MLDKYLQKGRFWPAWGSPHLDVSLLVLTESVHHRDATPLGLRGIRETDKYRWKTEGTVTKSHLISHALGPMLRKARASTGRAMKCERRAGWASAQGAAGGGACAMEVSAHCARCHCPSPALTCLTQQCT